MTESHRRLRDWKEIAAFFGRDERTVRRWERQRGLPVHRVSGGARNLVFAYTDELEKWLRSGGGTQAGKEATAQAEPDKPPVESSQEVLSVPLPPDVPRSRVSRPVAFFGLSLAAVIAIAAGLAAYVMPAPLRWDVHWPEPRVQDLYLDATYALGTRQSEGILRAIQLLTEATTLDPAYAGAYVKLAEAYNVISQYTSMPAAEAYPRAVAAANRALLLEPGNAGAHAALAFASFYWSKDFERSRELFERSIELDPNAAQTRHWFALTLMVQGEDVAPLREITEAQQLNPESRSIQANKGLILFYAGRVTEALSVLESLSQSEPHLRSPHEYLATIYLEQGRFADFLREYRAAALVSRNETRLAIADVAAADGLPDESGEEMLTAMLGEQIRQFELNRETAFKVAATAAMLGRDKLALRYLAESMRRGEADMIGVRIEPAFKVLRTDEAYRAIVERMGFQPIKTSDA